MNKNNVFKTPAGRQQVQQQYECLLDQWAADFEQLYVDTSLGKTFLLAAGDKSNPPLVLLHGSGSSAILWSTDMREYQRKYRVYAVDIPGEPGKSAENRPSLDSDAYGEWLREVFEGLGIKKAALLGISLGAWLAVKFTARYSERVSYLVLLCPSGISKQRTSFLFQAVFYALFGEKGFEKLSRKINGGQPLPEVVLAYMKLIQKHFVYRQETIPLYTDEELRRLTMPLALFVGGRDIMLHSAQTAERITKLLPHAQVRFIAEAGHSNIGNITEILQFLK